MFAVTTAEFTAEGTANILVNRFIPLWGCPSTLLSDNGPQFCARLATGVYKLLGNDKGCPRHEANALLPPPGEVGSDRRGRYPVGKARLYHRPEKGARDAA